MSLTAISLALGLAAAPVMAEEDWGAWDANGDGIIDEEEFTANFGENEVSRPGTPTETAS